MQNRLNDDVSKVCESILQLPKQMVVAIVSWAKIGRLLNCHGDMAERFICIAEATDFDFGHCPDYMQRKFRRKTCRALLENDCQDKIRAIVRDRCHKLHHYIMTQMWTFGRGVVVRYKREIEGLGDEFLKQRYPTFWRPWDACRRSYSYEKVRVPSLP